MQYAVITMTDPKRLSTAVTEALRDGWQLQGGVSVAMDTYGNFTYAQAVIKEHPVNRVATRLQVYADAKAG